MYFLYFIPNGGTLDQNLLDGRGLNYLSAKTMVSRGIMANGPEGLGGVLVADNRLETKRLYYNPAEQKWEKSINGKLWVGYWLDTPPTEKSLRRAAILDGHAVELLEGQPFTIPVARCFPVGTKLPKQLRITQKGELESIVMARYLDFCGRAERFWKSIVEQAEDNQAEPFTSKEQWDLLVEALGYNYAISTDEVNLLGLFTSVNFTPAVMAIIDGPKLIELGEKIIKSDEKFEELKKNCPSSDSEKTQPINSGVAG